MVGLVFSGANAIPLNLIEPLNHFYVFVFAQQPVSNGIKDVVFLIDVVAKHFPVFGDSRSDAFYRFEITAAKARHGFGYLANTPSPDLMPASITPIGPPSRGTIFELGERTSSSFP